MSNNDNHRLPSKETEIYMLYLPVVFYCFWLKKCSYDKKRQRTEAVNEMFFKKTKYLEIF